jgi:chromosome segregation ATPase
MQSDVHASQFLSQDRSSPGGAIRIASEKKPEPAAPADARLGRLEQGLPQEPAKRLEGEFEAARNLLHNTHKSLLQQQEALSNELARNSALKSQSRGASPLLGRYQPSVVEENLELEHRLKELESELQLQKAQASPISLRLASIEQRFAEAEAQNFLQKNQLAELQHLQKLKDIFDQENKRLRDLFEGRLRPTESDVELIKSNISQVRREIDEILRARAALNFKYSDLVQQLERLSRENDSLRLNPSKRADSLQMSDLIDQLNARNQRIAELNSELSLLRERLNAQSLPQPTHADLFQLRRELDHKNSHVRELENLLSIQAQNQLTLSQNNQLLSNQLFQLKGELDRIDTSKLKRDVEVSNYKLKSLEEENQSLRKELTYTRVGHSGNKDDHSTIKKLEDENRRLRRQVDRLSEQKQPPEQEEVSFRNLNETAAKDKKAATATTGLVTPSRPNFTSTKKRLGDEIDELLLGERSAMGEVSYEEMLKLEDRIKEFGECNVELEDLIYRLKAKMTGADYHSNNGGAQYYSSGQSSSADRRYNNRDAERFQKILFDLRAQVDRLADVRAAKQPAAGGAGAAGAGFGDMVSQLELIMANNRKHTEVEIKYHLMMKNYQEALDSLAELKDRYRQLEIKHNTIVSVNQQNEAHIEKLIGQIHDNKEYFKKLILEIQNLKMREKENAQELAEYYKRNGLLTDLNDDLARKSALA